MILEINTEQGVDFPELAKIGFIVLVAFVCQSAYVARKNSNMCVCLFFPLTKLIYHLDKTLPIECLCLLIEHLLVFESGLNV